MSYKVGRPTKYTQELAIAICDEIALGAKLVDICEPKTMPARSTVYLWLDEQKAFSDMYARARQMRGDLIADEIIEIADTEEDPKKARVRIDARKWHAARLNPKNYGDSQKIDHTSSDGSMTPQTTFDPSKLSTEALIELKQAVNEHNPNK